MKVTYFGELEQVDIEPKDICYIEGKDYACETHFLNGETLSLSITDMLDLLIELPEVHSYDTNSVLLINRNNVESYKRRKISDREDRYDITFKNGSELKNLSAFDYEKYIILRQPKENPSPVSAFKRFFI